MPRLQDGVLDTLSPGGVSMAAIRLPLSPGARPLLRWKIDGNVWWERGHSALNSHHKG